MIELKESVSLNADIRDGGVQKVMLHATMGVKHLNITVEVLDRAYVEANTASVEDDVAAFVAEACRRAAMEKNLPTSRITSG